jgi:hypothetical protein
VIAQLTGRFGWISPPDPDHNPVKTAVLIGAAVLAYVLLLQATQLAPGGS